MCRRVAVGRVRTASTCISLTSNHTYPLHRARASSPAYLRSLLPVAVFISASVSSQSQQHRCRVS